MIEINAFARKLQAYEALGESEIRLLVAASEPPRTIGPQRDLIREGDRPGAVFVVLEGWACRYKILPDGSRQIIAFLIPGDFCDIHVGELAEMDHSIGTITECLVTSIPRDEIEALIVSTPALARAFWRAQLIDAAVLRSWIVSMGRRDALERVAHLMLELYVRMHTVGLAGDDRCEMPLTQTVLADALGLTPIHLNRVLRRLRELEVMELRGKRLTISAPARLAKIAGFDDNYLHRRTRLAA